MRASWTLIATRSRQSSARPPARPTHSTMSGWTSWIAPRSAIAARAKDVGSTAVCTWTRLPRRLSRATANEDGLTLSAPNASKPVTSAFMAGWAGLLVRRVDRPSRHHADQMGAVLGAGMDVAVQAVGRDLDVLDGRRREVLGERVLHRLHAEDDGARAGHRHPHAVLGLGDEHADHGVARGGVRELHVGRLLGLWEADRGDQLAVLQRRLEQALEEAVGRVLAAGGVDRGVERQHRRRIVGRWIV